MTVVEYFPDYYLQKIDFAQQIDPHLESQINLKWLEDARFLPLTEAHFGLYKIIHQRYHLELGCFPDIVNGSSFNEKMQWLKLFDQGYDKVRCSDKLKVKDYIAERVGDQYILPAQQVFQTAEEINFRNLPSSFVIKANHDSGTVIIVREKNSIDFDALKNKLSYAISKPYGWENGEWAYRFVVPRIFTEELLSTALETSLADYKFFCSEGKVKFIHYIYDRTKAPKEIIVDTWGRRLDLSIHFPPGDSFEKPTNWEEMIWVAGQLSREFKFVRVDLYNHDGKIFVGELTFWPMYGMYQGEGQKRLGPLLDFSQNSIRPTILHELERRRWKIDGVKPLEH